MSDRVVRSVLVLAGLWALGCDGGTTPVDVGADAHVHADGGTDGGANDGGPVDGGPPDAGPTPCGENFCTDEQACVRGVCVAHCGSDASGWDAALAAGLLPVTSICRPAAARAVHVAGDAVNVWDLTTTTSGTETTFVVSRWPLAAPVPVEIARTSTDPGADAMLFTGGYLALAPTASLAAFGYTVSPSFDGRVHLVLAGGGTDTDLSAPGNFDAAFLDGSTLLVNGLGVDDVGLGEQGLYAVTTEGGLGFVRVAEGLGDFSGGVRVTDAFVLVGGSFPGFESRTYVIDRALVEDVVAGRRPTLDVDTAAETGTTASRSCPPPSPSCTTSWWCRSTTTASRWSGCGRSPSAATTLGRVSPSVRASC